MHVRRAAARRFTKENRPGGEPPDRLFLSVSSAAADDPLIRVPEPEAAEAAEAAAPGRCP
jgi:hypothetical protein